MISARDIRRAEFIIDQSRAVDILIDGYRTNRRGRPANRHGLRLMLIGMFLSIAHDGKATLTNVHKVLTKKLPLDDQLRLGVIDDDKQPIITMQQLYTLEQTLCSKLAYTTKSAPGLEPAERARRHYHMQTYCDALMDIFQVGAWPTSTVALDATGIWSWGRGYSTPDDQPDGSTPDDPCDELAVSNPTETDTGTDPDGHGRRRDPDASWGVKTSKNGEDERYFGFAEHTLVQVADEHDNDDAVPALIARFELTTAKEDVVDVSLRVIDRMPCPINDLVADRHYSYKAVGRWKVELVKRGINQHLDLRANEHGFLEAGSMRWVAGAAHCPGTPDSLGTITKPELGASDEKWDEFNRLIELRAAYAMSLHDRPGEDGTHRCVCPAVAGKVGCPLRSETVPVAVEFGLPIVDSPPTTDDGEPLPKCCTQQTVRVTPPESQFKLQQPHTWGSKKWLRIWNRRTYVEGSYGNRKNTSTENLRRGQFQVFGLIWAHIVMGLVNASYNLRMLENWCERHPDHGLDDHPLIAGDDDGAIGFVHVTSAEFAELSRLRAAAELSCEQAA